MMDLQNAFTLEKHTARALQQWLNERCLLDKEAVTSFAHLHADWMQWADQHDHFRSTPRRLAMALCYLGLKRCVIRSGKTRAYKGIALKSGDAV